MQHELKIDITPLQSSIRAINAKFVYKITGCFFFLIFVHSFFYLYIIMSFQEHQDLNQQHSTGYPPPVNTDFHNNDHVKEGVASNSNTEYELTAKERRRLALEEVCISPLAIV